MRGPDWQCLVHRGRGISQEGGKVALAGRNDLDEHGIRRASVGGQFSRLTERPAGGDDFALVRRQRNPARRIGSEELGEIRDANGG